jgi:hypothetical protein
VDLLDRRLFIYEPAINRDIKIKQRPTEDSQIALIANTISELHGGTQCFPRHLYDCEPEPKGRDYQAGMIATVSFSMHAWLSDIAETYDLLTFY